MSDALVDTSASPSASQSASQSASRSASVTRRTSAQAIDDALAAGRKALVAYLPVGFPDLPTSIAAARAAVEGGADVLELGMPYSDPLMDGPVIQHAVDAALRAGARTRHLFEAVAELRAGERADTGAACLVMTYWNPVDRYGVERFAQDFADAGGAGLITPDLIPDEAGPWLAASEARGLERVFLVAPSSTDARLASTVAASRGWIYAASLMGVTGVRSEVSTGARTLVERTRAAGAQRVCVGLGVSTAAQAGEVAGYADGVIVGSAFVRALAEASDPAAGVRAVHDLARDLAGALR